MFSFMTYKGRLMKDAPLEFYKDFAKMLVDKAFTQYVKSVEFRLVFDSSGIVRFASEDQFHTCICNATSQDAFQGSFRSAVQNYIDEMQYPIHFEMVDYAGESPDKYFCSVTFRHMV